MFGKDLHRVEGHIQDRRYVHVGDRRLLFDSEVLFLNQ